ncbi:type IV secretion system protein [Larkinella sp. GY13]|uniref:type IV secretion system protein n=1 Tax=Larkinella sp. GY13 TaxID=3453720 RepID=UPI003EEE81CC
MEDIGEGVIALINQIYANMIPTTEKMVALIISKINVVAAIGATLYIFANLIKQVYYNEEINFLPYMRPFLILMLIPISPTITDGIDTLSNEIRIAVNGSNSEISKRIESNSKLMQEAIDKKWDKIGNDEQLYEQTFGNERSQDDSGVFPISDDLKLMMGRSTDQIKIALVLLLQNLLITIMYIAEAALLLMSLCYRLILKMGFPIAITLTIFPGFTNNFITWFGKYINFSLLPAVAAMYSTIAFSLVDLYLQSNSADVVSGSDTQSPEFLGFAYIGILILALTGYLFVPSMTSMLVSIGGVGQIMGGTTRAVSQGAGTAARSLGGAAEKLGKVEKASTERIMGTLKGAGLEPARGASSTRVVTTPDAMKSSQSSGSAAVSVASVSGPKGPKSAKNESKTKATT